MNKILSINQSRLKKGCAKILFPLFSVVLLLASTQTQAQILELDLPANDIAYSTQTQMLFASVPSSAGLPYGNQLAQISTADLTILGSVFVGSEPDPIAVSPDAPIAYVGLDGAASVRSVDLSSLTALQQFPLGPAMGFGPLFASRIAVVPGNPNSIIVSRHDIGTDPDYQGVAIFDNGIPRSDAIDTFFGPVALAFDSSNGQLFGYDTYSDSGLYRIGIKASGLTIISSTENAFGGFPSDILADSGLLYATSGGVVDENSLELVGTYEASGPVVVEDDAHLVIFVDQHLARAFDQNTFVPLFSISIPASGNPEKAVACGASCIAILFDSDQIFLIQNFSEEIFKNGFE